MSSEPWLAAGDTQPRWPYHGTLGVAMDVDGVIYRSGALIPGSDLAVRMLQRLPHSLLLSHQRWVSDAAKAEEYTDVLFGKVEAGRTSVNGG